MRDLLDDLIDRLGSGPLALARVVSTSGATPRVLGSAMAVTATGEVLGSLSGGCVESTIVEAAHQVIADGVACSERFTSDAGEFGVGLVCGGEIEVFVERLDAERLPVLRRLADDVRARRAVGLITTVGEHPRWQLLSASDARRRGVHAAGSLVTRKRLDRDSAALIAAGRSGLVGTDDCEEPPSDERRPRAFVQTFAPPDRLIIAGANDFARALAVAARPLGWQVSIVDARAVFTTPARFPTADEIVVDWPHRYLLNEIDSGATSSRTALCVMTHDAKFDVPLLQTALETEEIGFIGALGSRRTHADRVSRLTETGLTGAQLARIHAPVGLDLGGHTPQETAIAILAEMIAWRHGASGMPLNTTSGPIH